MKYNNLLKYKLLLDKAEKRNNLPAISEYNNKVNEELKRLDINDTNINIEKCNKKDVNVSLNLETLNETITNFIIGLNKHPDIKRFNIYLSEINRIKLLFMNSKYIVKRKNIEKFNVNEYLIYIIEDKSLNDFEVKITIK